MWSDLKNVFRNFPSKIWCFGILPGICFALAVNALLLFLHLVSDYYPLTSIQFVTLAIFFWLAIWVSCLLLFAGYEITNEKSGEKFGKLFS
ncbi:hypothetical protein KKD72_02115 [Patescibacteria group bacterium]|nr:hypothetical protein [Patescibacteria group bacterium]